jgi:ankyrin repeat protein
VETEYLELLLSYGADIEARDRQGLSPLMRAVRLPTALPSVLTLLAHKADVNARADERHDFRSVLHYGVLSGSLPIVSLLLKSGAMINDPKSEKPSPLDLAILKGDIDMVQLLIEAGEQSCYGCNSALKV